MEAGASAGAVDVDVDVDIDVGEEDAMGAETGVPLGGVHPALIAMDVDPMNMTTNSRRSVRIFANA